MNQKNYHSNSKFLGAVGENNTIIQIINSGAEFVRGLAGRIFRDWFSGDSTGELHLLKERNEFLRRKLEIDQQLLDLEKKKIAYQQLKDEEKALQQQKLIELKEQENEIYKKEIELRENFYNSFIDALQVYHQSLLKLKGEELQSRWDVQNLPFYFSREETRRMVESGTGLLVLMAPPELPVEIREFASSLETEVEEALHDAMIRHYSKGDSALSVEFLCLFKRPIKPMEALHARGLFIRPTLILSSIVTDQGVHITVTCPSNPNDPQKRITDHQYRLKPWDWKEIAEQLEKEGKTRREALSVVFELISVLHVLIASYFSDVYFLSFDPFHEPRLYDLIKEFPSVIQARLQPYQESLRVMQLRTKIEALHKFALHSDSIEDHTSSIQAYRELIRFKPSCLDYYFALGDAIVRYLPKIKKQIEYYTFQKEAVMTYIKAFYLENYAVDIRNYRRAYFVAISLDKSSHLWEGVQKTELLRVADYFCDELLNLSREYEEIANFSHSVNLPFVKARLLLQKGSYNDTLRWIKKACNIQPNLAELWLLRAGIERKLGLKSKALVSLCKVVMKKKEPWSDKKFRDEVVLLTREFIKDVEVAIEKLRNRPRKS